MMTRALRLAVLCLVLAACQSAPEDVFIEARQAAERKDFDSFQTFFTARSATLIRGLRRVADETCGDYEYLPDKDLLALFPDGDIHDVEIRGRRAVLQVGRSKKRTEEVVLLREMDGWRVDVYDSERFWAPLTVKEDY